jgi:hypothetical protein
MLSESGKVISRRFMGRPVESGLLILAVAASWLLTLAFSVVPARQNSRNVPAEVMRAA